MPCLGQGQILQCRAMSQQATCELLVYSLAAGTFGQLQGTGLASEAYDFRLRFWDRFLGSFLNASSSKVTSLRAALWAEFWRHRNSTFWEPQCRPQSFRSLVGLLCAPILVTRFGSRVRVPVSESLCGPQNWTHAQYYIRMQSAYMPCLRQGQILQCRAMSQQATCELLV